MPSMRAGDVVAGRFELERPAGEGGMGVVWRARDRHGGGLAALKVVRRQGDGSRFAREVSVLASLGHPAIVRYLGQGTHEGAPWVAMEWLEGEDLAERLDRGPLSPRASLELCRRVASALAVVHAGGMVHRDVKPSNIRLPAGRVEDAKLVDFGVARTPLAPPVTRKGAVLGTPGYMAPEQARGELDVGPPADVFSLGCVLYECVTGVPAFSGEHLVAILAKVLMEQAPRLSEVAHGVSADLDALVAEMLAKDPARRPPDGASLGAELGRVIERLDADGRSTVLVPRRASVPLSTSESRFASVVLVGEPEPLGATQEAEAVQLELTHLRMIGEAYGAEVEVLADGSILTLSAGRGTPKERAAASARLAFALRKMFPDKPCALATGRAAVGNRLPIGAAIDRVSDLVREAGARAAVRVDPTTAGLLQERFQVADGWLEREREVPEGERRVLGRPVPCVGRERELAMLEAAYAECVSEPRAMATVLVAPAGMGKSRMVQELIGRLRAKGETFRLRVGRGDSMSAGSPLAIPRDALRRFFRVEEGVAPEEQRERLVELVATRISKDPRRVAWFLGELVGVPFDAQEDPAIGAARRDPRLMADQLRRAFEDLALGEASLGPVVVVLEDLHWGDAGTVSFIDSTLRLASELPLFVVATGRLELEVRFPNLWRNRGAQTIRLGDLTKRASEELVRAVLPDVSGQRAAALIRHAAGSPLFLEEMVRAEAEGRRGETPGTVLAMMSSSLEQLPPDLRRVLRAGSVFGRSFWRDATEELVGLSGHALDALLDALVDRELLLAAPQAKYPGQREYAFRHDLVREAAYALLTDEDRVVAHAHAGSWLEHAGEQDAGILAEHFEQGGDEAHAIDLWARAARQSLEAGNVDEALARAERGIVRGAEGETRSLLRLIQAGAAFELGDLGSGRRFAESALDDMKHGSALWVEAAASVVKNATAEGEGSRVEELGRELAELSGGPADPMYRAAINLLFAGMAELAARVAERALPADDAPARYAEHGFRALRHLHGGALEAAIAEQQRSVEAAIETRDGRRACFAYCSLGNAKKELGDMQGAAEALSAALQHSARLGPEPSESHVLAQHNLGFVRYCQGKLPDSVALQRRAATWFQRGGNKHVECAARSYLARALLAAGEVEEAEGEARVACALASTPWLLAYAQAVLAQVLTARGRDAEALAAAREAASFLDRGGEMEEGESLVRLALAEGLLGSGDRDAARAAIADGRRRLLERAARIRSVRYRQSFLENIPEHARTLALADQLEVPGG